MALEYRLHLNTARSAQQLITMVAAVVTTSVQVERNKFNETVYTTSGPGLTALVREPAGDEANDPDSLHAIVADVYAFRPTLTVSMRLDKFQFVQDTTLGALTMVDLLSHVLRQEPGDAVLLAERGLLLRRDGVIVLDATAGFWQPPLLARFALPYIWGMVPSL